MLVIGARGATGYVLGRGAGSAAANWWEAGGATNCVAAHQPKGAASLAASYVNLANPGTYDAAPGVAPTWDAAGGWTFNGTSQYLTTGVVPASGWSMIVRYTDASTATADRYIIGSFSTNARFAIQYQTFGSSRRYSYGSATVEKAATATSGVIALVAANGYFNGLLDATGSGAFTGTGQVIFIASWNINGVPSTYFSGKILALAIYSATLSAAQVAAVTAAMAAL